MIRIPVNALLDQLGRLRLLAFGIVVDLRLEIRSLLDILVALVNSSSLACVRRLIENTLIMPVFDGFQKVLALALDLFEILLVEDWRAIVGTGSHCAGCCLVWEVIKSMRTDDSGEKQEML